MTQQHNLLDEIINSRPQDSFSHELLKRNRGLLETDGAKERVKETEDAIAEVMLYLFMERLAGFSPALASGSKDEKELIINLVFFYDMIKKMLRDLEGEGISFPESIPLYTIAMQLAPGNDVQLANRFISIAGHILEQLDSMDSAVESTRRFVEFRENVYMAVRMYSCGADHFKDPQGEVRSFKDYLDGAIKHYLSAFSDISI